MFIAQRRVALSCEHFYSRAQTAAVRAMPDVPAHRPKAARSANLQVDQHAVDGGCQQIRREPQLQLPIDALHWQRLPICIASSAQAALGVQLRKAPDVVDGVRAEGALPRLLDVKDDTSGGLGVLHSKELKSCMHLQP
jgi:hypothetical protein